MYTNFRSIELEKRVKPWIDWEKTFNDLFLSFFPFFFLKKHRGGKNWRVHAIDRKLHERIRKEIRSALSLPPYRFEDYFLFLCFHSYETEICLRYEQPWPEKRVNIIKLWLRVTLVRVSRRCTRRTSKYREKEREKDRERERVE